MKQAGNGRAAVSGSSTEPITIEDNTVQHVKDVSGGRRGTYADGQVVPGQHETAAPAAARPAAVAEAVPSSFETPEDRGDVIVNILSERMIGHGSFGAVFLARIVETGEVVAIKKVLQDKRFKNRELQIMRQLMKVPHPYVVGLRQYFISRGSAPDDVYLNLVLEYVPETLYSVAKQFNKRKEPFPILSVKLYMFQLARALAHIHGIGICHRDIKPHNLLVDPQKQILKVCDFGSAKALVQGEPNVAYICSRYYRAPELILNSTDYSTAIDDWSMGCVLAELLLGEPIFPGSSGVDQLVEIIKVRGTPSREELRAMNQNYQEFRFPQIQPQPLSNVFPSRTPPEAADLTAKLLCYVPDQRIKSMAACEHEFFDDLRLPTTVLSDGSSLPAELFHWTEIEQQLRA